MDDINLQTMSFILNCLCENNMDELIRFKKLSNLQLSQVSLKSPEYLYTLYLYEMFDIEKTDFNLLLTLGKVSVNRGDYETFAKVMDLIEGSKRRDLITHTLMINSKFLSRVGLDDTEMPIYSPTLEMLVKSEDHEYLLNKWLSSSHWDGKVGKYLLEKSESLPKTDNYHLRISYLDDKVYKIRSSGDVEQLLRLMDKDYYRKMLSYNNLKFDYYDDKRIVYKIKDVSYILTSCPCNLQALIYLENGVRPKQNIQDIYLLLLQYNRFESLNLLLKKDNLIGLMPKDDTELNIYSYIYLMDRSNIETSWRFHGNSRSLVEAFINRYPKLELDISDIGTFPSCLVDLFSDKHFAKFKGSDELSGLVIRSLIEGNTSLYLKEDHPNKRYKIPVLLSGNLRLIREFDYSIEELVTNLENLKPQVLHYFYSVLEDNIKEKRHLILGRALESNDVFMIEYLHNMKLLPDVYTEFIERGEDTPAVWRYYELNGDLTNIVDL